MAPQRIGDFQLQPNPTTYPDGFGATYRRAAPPQDFLFQAHGSFKPQDVARLKQDFVHAGASVTTLTSGGMQYTCFTGPPGREVAACIWPAGSIVFTINAVPVLDPQALVALAQQAQAATGP